MGLRSDCYAKVWAARQVGKTYSVQTSVSYKDKETGQYKNSFNGYITFAGDAANKIRELDLPERMDKENPVYRSIKISVSPDITNFFNSAKYKQLLAAAKGNELLTNFIKANASPPSVTIWDFEIADDGGKKPSKGSGKASTKRRDPEPEEDDDSDELPF